MEISYLGHSCFHVKVGEQKILFDPYDKKTGKLSKTEPNCVVMTHHHHDHGSLEQVGGNPRVIDWPGEYEIGGVYLQGLRAFHDEQEGKERGEVTLFVLQAEGMRLAHLGDLGHKLSESELEKLGNVDILLIPVGGKYTIDAATARELCEAIDPRIVIPMHYRQEGIAVEGLAALGEFLKEMGVTPNGSEKTLKITKSSLPTEEMRVVTLERK